MKDYYKIGEISKIYGIGRDSLMYYEEIGILNPYRDTNGYRLYSISDIWRLNLIKELRSLNFPMKKIKEYLVNRSIESTNKMLNEEIELIDKKISELLSHRVDIQQRLKSIEETVNNTKFNEIKVEYIEKRKALKLNANIKRDEDVDFLIQKLQKEYENRFNILGNNNIGAVYSLDSIKNHIYNEFNSVFCLLNEDESIYNITFDGNYYITMTYRGSYSNNKEYINRMIEYSDEENYDIIGDPIEIYKIDVHETGKVEEFITEIQIPIKKRLQQT
ncbi:MerR family transcriptional regulator [Romboutsia ilealis]|uniref:MerR family transcriptional regulator n=1 Tax=Romboutsia faecis TaxID=2764597 RepID=A0ABR7JN71_9FIRM|nr:MerR family transcriptional regulator [Romboutsia faecis]MBC5996330.1 MerR family transcriptional regulator [Romboutsia faecis]MRN25029.1 MerR family transcriptional regulator [Romboutsia ilealis]